MVLVLVWTYIFLGALTFLVAGVTLAGDKPTGTCISAAVLWPIYLTAGAVWVLFRTSVILFNWIKSWNWSMKS